MTEGTSAAEAIVRSEPDQSLLAMPKRVDALHFTFTNRCNLRCSYCPQGTHPDSFHADADEAFMAHLFRFIRARQVREVGIGYYGEMLLFRDWWRDCAEILNQGVQISCVSNFSRVLEPQEVAVFARFREIGISIDTHDQAILKEVRKAVDVRTIVYNTQLIRAYCLEHGVPGPSLLWTGVLSPAVVSQMPTFLAFAAANGITKVHFNEIAQYQGLANQLRNLSELDGPDFAAAITRIMRAIQLAKTLGVELTVHGLARLQDRLNILKGEAEDTAESATREAIQGRQALRVFPSDRVPPGHTRACFSPWTELMVDPKGDVMACCTRGAIMGRLGSGSSLDAILDGDAYRRLRASLLSGEDLEPECALCPVRAVVPVEQFRAGVARLVLVNNR